MSIVKPKSKFVLNNIWEDDHIEKLADKWVCLWCNNTFKGGQAIRAMTHVACMYPNEKKNGIKFCEKNIPADRLNAYKDLLMKHTSKKTGMVQRKEIQQKNIEIENNNAALWHNQKQKLQEDEDQNMNNKKLRTDTVSTITTNTKYHAVPSIYAGNSSSFFSNRSSTTPKNPHFFSQLSLDGLAAAAHDTCKIDIAIADVIASHRLPFSFVESPKLKFLINLCCHCPINYKPPSRKQISGNLLDTLYEQYESGGIKELNNNVNIFGLSLMGDGATIKKKPLFNIIVSGHKKTAHVAKIHDCSKDLAEGENKNCEYIALLCRDVIEKYDPDGIYFDVILFDGASNVQKAGVCLEQLYPRLTTLHGCEHVVSLFCSDLIKKTRIKMLVTIYWKIYAFFGSGSSHMSYALFKHHAKERNNNREIGLIRAAGTRMAGYFYAFHRLCRLKWALRATINSEVWNRNCVFKNTDQKKKIEAIINSDEYFDALKMIVFFFVSSSNVLEAC